MVDNMKKILTEVLIVLIFYAIFKIFNIALGFESTVCFVGACIMASQVRSFEKDKNKPLP